MCNSTTMEYNFVGNIIELYERRDWKKIINECDDDSDHSNLLWVFPSEENIAFINRLLQRIKCKAIVSVGCGCGLLEWILMESLGITVTGIEVDGAWWDCKYAPKAFIPLHMAKFSLEDDSPTQAILNTKDTAMLFCYFNNGPAFSQYMKYFNGNMIFIIGPGEGRHTHTDPTPFGPSLDSQWQLIDSQEVRNTKDFIAVYQRG